MNAKGNRQYRFFLIFFYYFIFKPIFERWIDYLKYLDELIAICAIPIFLIQLCRDRFKLRVEKRGYGKCWVVVKQ